MNCSYFGSFSKQTFMDLYALNVRSHHLVIYVYEIMEREVANTTRIVLDDPGHNVDLAHDLKRLKSSSYLIGLLLDDEAKLYPTMQGYDVYGVSMVDTFDDKPLSYCMEKNKEFIQLSIVKNAIGVQVGRRQKVYLDQFQSITDTPMSGFSEMGTPNIHYLNIRNITKD